MKSWMIGALPGGLVGAIIALAVTQGLDRASASPTPTATQIAAPRTTVGTTVEAGDVQMAQKYKFKKKFGQPGPMFVIACAFGFKSTPKSVKSTQPNQTMTYTCRKPKPCPSGYLPDGNKFTTQAPNKLYPVCWKAIAPKCAKGYSLIKKHTKVFGSTLRFYCRRTVYAKCLKKYNINLSVAMADLGGIRYGCNTTPEIK